MPSHHGCDRQTPHHVARHPSCRGAVNRERVVALGAAAKFTGRLIKAGMVVKCHQSTQSGEVRGDQQFGSILTVRFQAPIRVRILFELLNDPRQCPATALQGGRVLGIDGSIGAHHTAIAGEMKRQDAAGCQSIEHRQLIRSIAWTRASTEEKLMEQLCFTVQQPDPLDQLSAGGMVAGSKRLPGSRRKKHNPIGASGQQAIQTTLAEPGGSQSFESLHHQKTEALDEPSSPQLAPHPVIRHRLRWRWIRRHQPMVP